MATKPEVLAQTGTKDHRQSKVASRQELPVIGFIGLGSSSVPAGAALHANPPYGDV